jgi:hypothetical protein
MTDSSTYPLVVSTPDELDPRGSPETQPHGFDTSTTAMTLRDDSTNYSLVAPAPPSSNNVIIINSSNSININNIYQIFDGQEGMDVRHMKNLLTIVNCNIWVGVLEVSHRIRLWERAKNSDVSIYEQATMYVSLNIIFLRIRSFLVCFFVVFLWFSCGFLVVVLWFFSLCYT